MNLKNTKLLRFREVSKLVVAVLLNTVIMGAANSLKVKFYNLTSVGFSNIKGS
jgi:hypothetical protein